MSHIPGTVHVDRVKPGAWVLALRGEHDEAGGAGTVGAALVDISRDHLVVFDLSEVTFIETMALARLLDAASRQREAGGDVWFVVEPQTFASRLFEVTAFNRMLEVFESREAAMLPCQPASAETGDSRRSRCPDWGTLGLVSASRVSPHSASSGWPRSPTYTMRVKRGVVDNGSHREQT